MFAAIDREKILPGGRASYRSYCHRKGAPSITKQYRIKSSRVPCGAAGTGLHLVRALEFTILTAARTNEAIGARWDEIDIKGKVWTIPADRMKSGRSHRVPLSERAVEILSSTPQLNGSGAFVFPGGKAGRPLSNMAMLELVRGIVGNGITVHGFRSSFKDWAREQTSFPNELSEALAHVIRDKTEAAYARGDLFDKRRKLMDTWAAYCAGAKA